MDGRDDAEAGLRDLFREAGRAARSELDRLIADQLPYDTDRAAGHVEFEQAPGRAAGTPAGAGGDGRGSGGGDGMGLRCGGTVDRDDHCGTGTAGHADLPGDPAGEAEGRPGERESGGQLYPRAEVRGGDPAELFRAAGADPSVVAAWTRQPTADPREWDWGDRPAWDDAVSSDGDHPPAGQAQPPRPHRAFWTARHQWCDPDCFECGGEGAPCCDPPVYPYPGRAEEGPRQFVGPGESAYPGDIRFFPPDGYGLVTESTVWVGTDWSEVERDRYVTGQADDQSPRPGGGPPVPTTRDGVRRRIEEVRGQREVEPSGTAAPAESGRIATRPFELESTIHIRPGDIPTAYIDGKIFGPWRVGEAPAGEPGPAAAGEPGPAADAVDTAWGWRRVWPGYVRDVAPGGAGSPVAAQPGQPSGATPGAADRLGRQAARRARWDAWARCARTAAALACGGLAPAVAATARTLGLVARDGLAALRAEAEAAAQAVESWWASSSGTFRWTEPAARGDRGEASAAGWGAADAANRRGGVGRSAAATLPGSGALEPGPELGGQPLRLGAADELDPPAAEAVAGDGPGAATSGGRPPAGETGPDQAPDGR